MNSDASTYAGDVQKYLHMRRAAELAEDEAGIKAWDRLAYEALTSLVAASGYRLVSVAEQKEAA